MEKGLLRKLEPGSKGARGQESLPLSPLLPSERAWSISAAGAARIPSSNQACIHPRMGIRYVMGDLRG